MAANIFLLSCLCLVVSAAPPSPPRLFQQHPSAQLQQITPYEYYLENQEVANYYNHQAQNRQGGNSNANSNGAPSRLETLEPDSEVELIPGAQQPQQPPQQTPVSPNLPGYVPGRNVFIVHMPVPGYRPGTIGGYQPVYIVAAAPQGPAGYPGNGYQNAILLDHTGQAVISPLGYPKQFGVAQGGHPGFLLGPQFNRPYDQAYQEPVLAFQAGPGYQGNQGLDAAKGADRLNQYTGLQGQNANIANRPANNDAAAPSAQQLQSPSQSSQSNQSGSAESPEVNNETRRRTVGHPQIRGKAKK